eukprot:gene21039-17116_t
MLRPALFVVLFLYQGTALAALRVATRGGWWGAAGAVAAAACAAAVGGSKIHPPPAAGPVALHRRIARAVPRSA